MRRLNNARVALKHHGTLPSQLDIEAFPREHDQLSLEIIQPIRVPCESSGHLHVIEYVSPESAPARN